MSIPTVQSSRYIRFFLFFFFILGIVIWGGYKMRPLTAGALPTTSYPILFVTQIPIASDFTTIGSTFGNHRGTLQSAARGGDLWLRDTDGTLTNLTADAGFGATTEFQGADSIAVRDPSVHWDGDKALFSMVIGAPEQQYQIDDYYWQIYEVRNLLSENPEIVKVSNQPENFNNISPIYGTDDQIIFTSDRPINGQRHLYPQLDEYESAPTNTGLWRLNPDTGDLQLLNHAPSGDFTPIINSNGRIIFTQWDHMQRDQQADADANTVPGNTPPYGAFNYSHEGANALKLNDRTEVFPEPRADRPDLLVGTNLKGHRFNHFFPWEINQDGTEGEVLLHLGRHELHNYIDQSVIGDPNIVEYYRQYPRTNPNSITNMFQVKEDPNNPETYYGVDAPEFTTHASGYIIRLAVAGKHADQVVVEYMTNEDSSDGHYREPLPLSDGSFVVVHTPETDGDDGSGHNSDYDFRLKTLVPDGNGGLMAGVPLTNGISKSITYWNPNSMSSYNGVLWELNPVEVRPRTRPTPATFMLPAPEQQIFDEAGVPLSELQAFMIENDLALVVSRNVTTRDDLDRQQPFNLRVVGGGAQTIGTSGEIYDVAHMQFFQGKQIRGYERLGDGRRVLAQNVGSGFNPPVSGPVGSVALGLDGSMAAFVPTNRAVTWQLTDEVGEGVVRERYWLTFQPGEVRVCASCHGLNEQDQAGQSAPTNPPQALADLLDWYQVYQTLEPEIYLPAISR